MDHETDVIKSRYNRIAPYFDAIEGVIERTLFSALRQRLWSRVESGKVLEVGVGTGKNFLFYPSAAEITAIDFSPRMLEQARRKAATLQLQADLRLMDVQQLDFPDNSFDMAIGTFVFCSVPDPMQGLQEIRRVLKAGGRLLLLEHVLSSNRLLAAVMDLCNPLVTAAVGANINRNTVENVKSAGFVDIVLDPVSSDMIKLLEARKAL